MARGDDVITRVSDWLIYVAPPGVTTGLMFGVAGWLLITLPFWALGVIP